MQSFDALFAADRDPQRREFLVAEHPCWVDLRPMGQADLQKYQLIGVEYAMVQDEPNAPMRQELKSIDLVVRETFLVQNTLIDWEWVRPVNGQLQVCRPPEDERQKRRYLEMDLRGADPAFWRWLVFQCEVVNGLTPDDQGN
jgi:hypothetical protein